MRGADPLVASFYACWLVFATATPCTYVLGANLLHHVQHSASGKVVTKPGWAWGRGGGVRTLVFQVLSAASWLAGGAVAWPALGSAIPLLPTLDVELLAAAAAVGAVCSELFQISALLVFDPYAVPLRIWVGLQPGQTDVMWQVSKMPSRSAAFNVVIAMGALWMGLGAALLHLGLDVLAEAPARAAYAALAAMCFTTAVFTTYGLAGHLRHAVLRPSTPAAASDGSDEDDSSAARQAMTPAQQGSWHFFQPFRGGAWFVATQALGWALYSAALCGLAYLVAQAGGGVVEGVRLHARTAAAAMFTAQTVLTGSLLLFQGPQTTISLVRQFSLTLREESRPRNLRQRLAHATTVTILYVPGHVACAGIVMYFLVLPPLTAATLLGATMFVYYSATCMGGPAEISGRREWPAFQRWFGRQLEEVLPDWMGSLEVVREAPAEAFDPERRYVFGFAPHGLYPLSAGYLPLLPSFQKLLPGIRPITLSASVVFIAPVLRDILTWLGLRVVTRRSFVKALRERGAVLVVPGGQAELVHTHRIHARHRELCIYRSHKGFVRLALQNRAQLVPVLVFGEVDSLSNLVSLPWMLNWSYKRLGFPVPYFIVGRWWLSPFPKHTGLRFVIGEPLPLPEECTGDPSPTEVDRVHALFYKEVERLWAKHQPTFPGYEDVKLVMVDK